MNEALATGGALAYEHNGTRIGRDRFYAIACDPRRSVAVEACAGAGKTWMLVSRIVRALLAGAQPHEILAITFTKKAAGEMRQRLHEWLAGYARASPEELLQALVSRGVVPAPAPEALQALKNLYAALLASGRPAQIRTFHSWFAALLRNAPLAVLEQLGLPAHYELLEDDSQAIAMVWRRFHAAVADEPAARADFEASVAAHGRSQTQKALQAALAKRVEFALADAHGVVDASIKAFGEQFPEFAGLREPGEVLQSAGPLQTFVDAARALGRAQAPSFSAKGIELEIALAAGDLQGVLDALLTRDGAPRRFSEKIEGLDRVRAAQALALRAAAARAQHEAWRHHQRMARLARLLVAEFAALKRERGWVDMNDVERAALAMLSDPVLSGWVQERLDARVKHVLIDEFQDTNPLQWQALYAWLSSYAGAGGDAPSVFIVGDPKQSIYRFRRAEPQVFRAAQAFVVDTLAGDLLSCDHTRRNAPAVLEAVNEVMAGAQQAGQYEGFRAHSTESPAPGQVAHLPQIPRGDTPRAAGAAGASEPLHWRDSLTTPRELPEEKLIALECRQAAAWIAQQIAAGAAPQHIMVLARKRDRLGVMEDELRALRIAAQQPERADLCEAPEVQDVAALLDALVSPAHDLSLARALKSPLFALGDEALATVALAARDARAAGRPASWFELLQGAEGLAPEARGIGATLQRWKGWVETLPPHDALETIYHDGDVLARFAAAAPARLRDAVLARLRALPGAALQVGGGRYATPYAFVRALKAGGIEGPALSQTQAVRLLTVHGAKGLEAPIVLVLDADAAAPRAETMGVVVEWPREAPAPWRFAFIASESRPPPCSAEALEVERAARQREELNALYVAMTRARERLVFSSVQPHAAGESSWWQRVLPFCGALEAPQRAAGASAGAAAGPARFELAQLPQLRGVTSRGVPQPAAALPPESEESRFGQALHRLLEGWTVRSPDFTAAQLRRVAREFALSEAAAAEAAAMARRILGGEGAWAWDPERIDWQGNELPMHHGGELLRLDRLVRRAGSGEWWVLDYKSAARPELEAALVEQLTRYRVAVQAAYPGDAVKAAFLTGQGRLVLLP